MRKVVTAALRNAHFHAMAVDNEACSPGTPDIFYHSLDHAKGNSYITGWIELKFLREFPKRESTPVRFPHYTPQQRIWHRDYPGRCNVLALVNRHWIVMRGYIAAEHLGNLPVRDLLHEDKALAWWTGSFDFGRLRPWL
jgi:hypothetical protein